MAPLVRRSWSRRGQTPSLYQRGRSHQKVTIIAALCVAADRRNLHLYFRLHPSANITGPLVIHFLRNLLRQLPGPLIVIWDRLLAHRGKLVGNFLRSEPRLHTVLLPPYAPELNPVENVWCYLKMNAMANWAPLDMDMLTRTARRRGRSIQRRLPLLRSFLLHSPLFLRLK